MYIVPIFYEVGISSFYYGTSSEFDTEYYYEFLKELVGKNGPGLFKEGNTVDTVIDIIPDVESAKDYLTPEGYRLWYDALIKKGEKTMRWWLENRIHINEETGLIYVERAMDLESLFGRYHDNYDNDYYETLEDKYSGIGEYWSYAYGGGNVYFYSAQHPDNVIVRGWVSPLSVDWGATISLDSMDEQELRLNYDTVVQIDKIEAWDNENGKINLLGNRGSVLMKIM